ncbi:GMC oxidoreductase [Glonium stellatum]|uniref:GMC oxidoreductase n=1 Tax=Glonium stellatum TaxID=574774 RepID=A0A8E2JVW7_9PEZI|nr:GMC oxidoreductase [Glonium stellatum]
MVVFKRISALLFHLLSICELGRASFNAFRDIAELKRSISTINGSYDYIIVGGGTSGLTIADRLTEDASKSVLVVEYGYLDDGMDILLPTKFNLIARDIYNITGTPQVELDNRTTPILVGAVIGGCSAINTQFFDRGSINDYDAWAEIGNPGWGWNDLYPYFKKSTYFTPPSKEMVHDFGITYDTSAYGHGPIQASYPPFQFPGLKIMWKAWDDVGITGPIEGAEGHAIGKFWVPSSQDPTTQTRSYARTGYYDPVRTRPNYHLLTGHKVTKVNFSPELRAKGVTIQTRGDPDSIVSILAGKEVILAAGAVHTPQVLQLSGIGPKALLEKAKIPVLLDLPGVGANFQDHPFIALTYNYTTNVYPYPELLSTNSTYLAEALAQYYANKTGPYTWGVGNSAAFLPLQTISTEFENIASQLRAQDPAAYLPESSDKTVINGYKAQRDIIAKSYESKGSAVFEFVTAGKEAVNLAFVKPISRGTIRINPTNISAEPVVNWRSASNPIDLDIEVEMIRYARKYMDTPTMAQLGPVELVPGRQYNFTDALKDQLRSTLLQPSTVHPCCTAAMMPLDLGGVVGSDLLVYGVKGLSVVDASVMPMIPATHLSATVYAVAEKAADIIKSRAY